MYCLLLPSVLSCGAEARTNSKLTPGQRFAWLIMGLRAYYAISG